VNIWSKHELEERRRKAEDEAYARGRYLSAEDRFISRSIGAGGVTVDRADNQGRRYNRLLMTIRQARPEWSADSVRAEAQRLLKLEDPDQPPPSKG
jgi:hypothetical protein